MKFALGGDTIMTALRLIGRVGEVKGPSRAMRSIFCVLGLLACHKVESLQVDGASLPVANVSFVEALGDNVAMPTKFECSVGRWRIIVRANGETTIDQSGGKTTSIALGATPSRLARLEVVWCASNGKNVLLQLSGRYGEDGAGGELVRLDPMLPSIMWRLEVGGNPGTPYVKGDTLYLSAYGMVGKALLVPGTWVWQHRNLRDPDGAPIVAFESAQVAGNRIVFPVFEAGIRHPWPATMRAEVVVDDLSGELLSPRFSPSGAGKHRQ